MWTRIKALVWKELLQLRRDKLTLVFILGLPLMQPIIYGFAVNSDVKHLPTAVYDESNSQESRDFLEALRATQYFDTKLHVHSEKELTAVIDGGRAQVGVWFPPDYARKLRGGGTAQAMVIVDASNPTTANTAMATAFGVGQTRATSLLFERMGFGQATRPETPISVRIRPWYNPNLRSPNFIIPGLVGVILSMTCIMFAANSMVREKERGTLDQVMVTPVTPLELFLGKIIPVIGIAYIQMTFMLVFMRVVFQVPVAGNPLLLYLMAAFFIFAMLGIGIRISTVAQTQAQASQMSFMMFLPLIFLSGYIFPLEGMPLVFQVLGQLVPLTHFIEILRAIVLRGVGLEVVWLPALKLVFFIVAIWALALRGMRRAAA